MGHMQRSLLQRLNSLFGNVLESTVTKSTNALHPVESEMDPLSSQKGQVRFLLEVAFNYSVNGLRRSGYFVGLAAGHPTSLSNTYFLERYLGWSGLLIEPNPTFADALRRDRRSPVVQSVVGQDGKTVPFRFDNNELGGIVGDEYDNSPVFRHKELASARIEHFVCRSLSSILQESGSPPEMDYLSLDVEGSEWTVLRDFDFDRWRWKAITAERPSNDLNLLLDSAGYIQVGHCRFDTFYIHKNFMSQADRTKIKPQFRTTPPKSW